MQRAHVMHCFPCSYQLYIFINFPITIIIFAISDFLINLPITIIIQSISRPLSGPYALIRIQGTEKSPVQFCRVILCDFRML